MNDTFFFPTPERYARIAMAYNFVKESQKLFPAGQYIYRKGGVYPMPEGGLYSTAEDYAKFLECIRMGGRPLLSKAMTDVMIEDHLGDVQCPWGRFGLGFSVDTAKQGFGHGGAFGTHGWSERKTGITRVFMVQKFGGPVEEIRNAFVNLVNGSIQ
jgi:CubicO group peptidase (beta-lactamase class C family)